MLSTALVGLAITAIAFARRAPLERRGPVPEGIVDPGAHPDCTLWHENVNGTPECQLLIGYYDLTPAQLLGWVRDCVCTSRASKC